MSWQRNMEIFPNLSYPWTVPDTILCDVILNGNYPIKNKWRNSEEIYHKLSITTLGRNSSELRKTEQFYLEQFLTESVTTHGRMTEFVLNHDIVWQDVSWVFTVSDSLELFYGSKPLQIRSDRSCTVTDVSNLSGNSWQNRREVRSDRNYTVTDVSKLPGNRTHVKGKRQWEKLYFRSGHSRSSGFVYTGINLRPYTRKYLKKKKMKVNVLSSIWRICHRTNYLQTQPKENNLRRCQSMPWPVPCRIFGWWG